MSRTTADIVADLRKPVAWTYIERKPFTSSLHIEAADRLTELDAEVTRLQDYLP